MRSVLPVFFATLSAIFVILFFTTHTVQESEANQPQNLKEADKAEVVKQLGNLPAFFIENQGQTAEEVRYYFKGSDTVYFTDGAVVFQKLEALNEDKETGHTAEKDNNANNADPEPAKGLAYRLEFVGANPTTPQARKQLGGRVNYFIGNDPSKWHNNIPTYQEIVYPELYGASEAKSGKQESSSPKTIDLVYKGVKGGMKYEFIVHPGADPDVIKMSYTGIDGLSIDA